jgi:hypothetical protein
VHIGADGRDRRPLPRGEIFGEQGRGRRLAPILPEADHFAVHDIGQHGPKPLPLAALNFIEADMPGPAFHARPIPLREEGFLGPTRLGPTHAMADGRMTGGDRLTVDADLLPQAPGDARLRIRELNPLGSNPAVPTDDAPLPIHERDVMRGPRQTPFCTMALADSVIERDLGIDGVTESAMYIAGVGTRPTGGWNVRLQRAALRS